MQIVCSAFELKPGDVIDGKKVIIITPPPMADGSLWIYFEGVALPMSVFSSAQFLVERDVERID